MIKGDEHRVLDPLHTQETQTSSLGYFQVSTTVETFQDLSLPIPGKEDLAKLHSAIYQNVPAKTGACGDSYASQSWIAFIMEYIRRCVPSAEPLFFWGLPSSAGRHLSLTSDIYSRMSIVTILWRTVCGTSQVF